MRNKQYFDQVAGQWDQMRRGFFPEDVRNEAFRVTGIQPGSTAADIGAGTGFVSEGLINRGLKVLAVDQSEAMLNELKKKFDTIECRQGQAEQLPLDDESVDYVFANMYLHHVRQPLDALKEMVRILKAGGKLAITDLDEHTFEFLKEEHCDRWMGFKRDRVEGWLKLAGLKEVRVDGVGQNCCADSCNSAESASISIFVAYGKKQAIAIEDGRSFSTAPPSKGESANAIANA
jgi:ubiquinone/menaquinone biosynthesis C-methylase UbiE